MPVESVYARLEPLLPLVRKPVQYVGGELNAVVKAWDAADVRWALMIAGGHAAFNPEPVAEFLDGAVLGDGEQAVLAITGQIRDWKRAGRPGGRDGLLAALAADGVYVPRFYDVDYLPDGRIRRVAP